MADYINTESGEIWTEEEVREEYEKFKHELEDPKDNFEEYLEDLIQKGELKIVTRYYIIDNQCNVCGESDSRVGIELILSNYSPEEIERNELEIIGE